VCRSRAPFISPTLPSPKGGRVSVSEESRKKPRRRQAPPVWSRTLKGKRARERKPTRFPFALQKNDRPGRGNGHLMVERTNSLAQRDESRMQSGEFLQQQNGLCKFFPGISTSVIEWEFP
jgi:hypothetical protein